MAAEPSDPAQLAMMRDPPLLGGVEDDGQGGAAALLLHDSPTPQHRAGEALAAGTVDNPSNRSDRTNNIDDINDHLIIPTSQEKIPSTQGPASPLLSDLSASVKTELNEPDDSPAISSSLTPPPSSQFPRNPVGPAAQIITMTTANAPEPVKARRDGAGAAAASAAVAAKHFATPTAQQMADASADELRRLLQASLAEHARLKMEAAHHKLQFQLLSLQADDDAKRAAVEHDMMRREVEALRAAGQMARRSAIFSKATSGATAAAAAVESSAAATAQRNLQLQSWCDRLVADNEALDRRWRLAKKVIRQKDSELMDLRDERDMALNRIRENREHMQILCSPGGMFHGAYTPKAGQQHQHQAMSAATPGQYGANPGGSKATPRHSAAATGRPPPHGDREPGDQGKERFAALLQALSQDNNNSAPSTPTNAGAGHHHQASAHQRLGSVSGVGALEGARTASLRHTRNVQSMSSLPTTPAARTIDGLLRAVHPGSGPTWGPGHGAGLLPSVDLVPQSAPPYRRGQESGRGGAYGSESRFPPQTPSRPMMRDRERRKSRESTISADEMEPDEENNEELARQALQSVAAAASHVARAAGGKSESERMTQSMRRSGSRDSKLSPQKMKRSGKQARDDDGHGAGTGGRGQQQQQENNDDEDEDKEEVQESQASLEALEMLRRDPRESFDVISSAEGSRDGTPELGGGGGRLQKQLLGTGAGAGEKRKFSASSSSSNNSNNKNMNNGGARGKAGGCDDQAPGDDAAASAAAAGRREFGSPTKRLRVAGGLRGDSRRVGLGIQYGTGA